MSDDLTPDEQDDTPDGVKNLREALARKTEEAKAGLAALRTLAFRDAGIDTTKGVGAMFLEHYKGELTAEAITADATNWGISTTPDGTPPPTDPADIARAQEEDRQRRLAADGTNTPPGDDDDGAHPGERILEQYDEMVASGLSRDKARAHAVSEMLGSAFNGNDEFRWSAEQHRASAVPETETKVG